MSILYQVLKVKTKTLHPCFLGEKIPVGERATINTEKQMIVNFSKQSNKLERNENNWRDFFLRSGLWNPTSQKSVSGGWVTVKCFQEVRSDCYYISGMQEHCVLWSPNNGDAAKTKQNNNQTSFLMTHSPYLCGNSGHPSIGTPEDFTGARRLWASWRVSRRGVFCSQ